MKLALVLFKYGVPISDPCCFPLGFMTISAVLKKAGHDVTVFNLNLGGNEDDVVSACTSGHFEAVCFTGFEEFRGKIERAATACRESGTRTILGGALATFKPLQMLEYVDTVIEGEGENVIEEALTKIGIIQGTRPDLSALPLPDYEGFGIDEYHRRHGLKYMGVLTSRGCPHACTFCAHTCSYQCRKLSQVFEEIDLYKAKYGVEMIVFNDNTLNVNEGRFLRICREMKARKLAWSSAIRTDRFDEETARAAAESGCKYFVVGVESFNQAKLDRMNKRVTVKQITNTLDLLHKYRIDYHGNVLFGFPGETYTDIMEEIRTMPQGYNIFPAMVRPFVGTRAGHHTLTAGEYDHLDRTFKQYIHNSGKYCYPDLEAA